MSSLFRLQPIGRLRAGNFIRRTIGRYSDFSTKDIIVTADKTDVLISGAANNGFDFSIKSYRIVDSDININQILYSTLVNSPVNTYLPTRNKITPLDISQGIISRANASTYLANAAIDTAYIADLSVTTGKIANLAVDTLQIAGNAVVVPLFITFSTNTVATLAAIAAAALSPYVTLSSFTIDLSGGTSNSKTLIETDLTNIVYHVVGNSGSNGAWLYDIVITNSAGTVVATIDTAMPTFGASFVFRLPTYYQTTLPGAITGVYYLKVRYQGHPTGGYVLSSLGSYTARFGISTTPATNAPEVATALSLGSIKVTGVKSSV